MGVASGSLQTDSQPGSFGLGWGSAAAWRRSTFIVWTGWTLAVALIYDDSTINIVVIIIIIIINTRQYRAAISSMWSRGNYASRRTYRNRRNDGINMATACLTNYFRCLRRRVISQSATASAVTSRRCRRHLTGCNSVDILPPIVDQGWRRNVFIRRPAHGPRLIGHTQAIARKFFHDGESVGIASKSVKKETSTMSGTENAMRVFARLKDQEVWGSSLAKTIPWSRKKTCHFYFYCNFGRCGSFLIFFTIAFNCRRSCNEIYHLALNLLSHYLGKFECLTACAASQQS